MTLNTLRQYALHVLFVPPVPSPDGTLDDTSTSAQPTPFCSQAKYARRRPQCHASGWGRLRQDRGVARQLRHESVGRGMEARTTESIRSATPAREMHALLVHDQGLKVRS